ncbi:MAG: hypothetical protein H7X99_06450 [Saprospiraceae bacterium]|nr:hypothetical protein [Saprospiraceae bacterium]
MRFVFPQTLEILQKAGMNADHSLGYRTRIGYRCGTGFPYSLYNLTNESMTDIVEHPLVIMDQCLLKIALNQKVNIKDVHDAFIDANKYLTLISYNFHNSIFDYAEMRGMDIRRTYNEIVR